MNELCSGRNRTTALNQTKQGHISYLYVSHVTSKYLVDKYHLAFVIDCTYKTNRYGMPLLHIFGWPRWRSPISLSSGKLLACLVADREVALINGMEIVFPSVTHFLDFRHINKNILAACKREFLSADSWNEFVANRNTIVRCSAVNKDKDMCDTFEAQFEESHVKCITYLRKTCLPWKEHFMEA